MAEVADSALTQSGYYLLYAFVSFGEKKKERKIKHTRIIRPLKIFMSSVRH